MDSIGSFSLDHSKSLQASNITIELCNASISKTPLSFNKENANRGGTRDSLEQTRVLHSVLNSALQDRTNTVGQSELRGNCSADKMLALGSSAQLNAQAKVVDSSCSPWEGCNPLIWCRSIDSVMSRISSQRKGGAAQNNGGLNCKSISQKELADQSVEQAKQSSVLHIASLV